MTQGAEMSRPSFFDRFDSSISDRWLQLALFDPCEDEPQPLRVFGYYPDNSESRRYLRTVLKEFRRQTGKRPDIVHCLGIFPAKVPA